jgi:hypothetical protein
MWTWCIHEYKKIYPDYEIIVYDNKDIYAIIEKYYKEYLPDIKKIKIGAVLADIFRYLILYLEGGIYSDMDCLPLQSIDTLFDCTQPFFHNDENRLYKNRYFIHSCKTCILNNTNTNTYTCMGHQYIHKNTDVIVCYEFYPNQICQWFMISKPKQQVFLDCFLACMKNIRILQNVNKYSPDYSDLVVTHSGPKLFTKMILQDTKSNIAILPEVFFCCGSNYNTVPITKSSYVKHYFMNSWR